MHKEMKKLFILLIVITDFSFAQTTDKLSLKEAISIGLQNNVALGQAKNNLVATNFSKTNSLLQLTPSFNIQGSAGRNDGNTFIPQEGRVVNGVVDFVNATLNAEMPLFNGFNNVNTYLQNDKTRCNPKCF
jgi:outer membrane protein